MFKNSVKKFRQVGNIEGYSYLILLLIAMPLKYILGYAIAVKIVGMAHGVLFILFCLLLLKASNEAQWSMKDNAIFFIASLIPFGTFYTDNRIKAYESKV